MKGLLKALTSFNPFKTIQLINALIRRTYFFNKFYDNIFSSMLLNIGLKYAQHSFAKIHDMTYLH